MKLVSIHNLNPLKMKALEGQGLTTYPMRVINLEREVVDYDDYFNPIQTLAEQVMSDRTLLTGEAFDERYRYSAKILSGAGTVPKVWAEKCLGCAIVPLALRPSYSFIVSHIDAKSGTAEASTANIDHAIVIDREPGTINVTRISSFSLREDKFAGIAFLSVNVYERQSAS